MQESKRKKCNHAKSQEKTQGIKKNRKKTRKKNVYFIYNQVWSNQKRHINFFVFLKVPM